jgi:glycosyltransferase 2 family protein
MRRDRRWVRPLLGASILGVLAWRVGAGPFVDGLRRVDGWTLLVGAAIAVVTTVCGAWRWVLVARGLGVELSLRAAVAECYRSQFLNVTLPGGVVGDVRRGVGHGRGAGDVSRGLRSVLWERSAGQLVLAVVTVGVLVALPSPLRGSRDAAPSPGSGSAAMPPSLVILAILLLLLGAAVVARVRRRRWRQSQSPGPGGLVARSVAAVGGDLRAGVLGRHTWPGVVAASAVVVTGHVATFLLAARSAGVTASPTRLLPLALLVLVAMSLPLNVAGWGPREGAAAWAFGAAGLGAAAGLATAVAYGVMSLVACLPGAALLVLSRRRATLEASTPSLTEAVHG